jgi:tetratricopeptide (TPR) repeat protein
MDQPPQPPQPPPSRISFEEIVVWVDDRKKLILTVIALLGIAGLVYVSYNSSQAGKRHRATAALFNFQAANNLATNPPPAASYRELLPQTEGTGIAQHVKLREAASLYTAGQYAEAQQAFEAFLRDFPNSPLLPEATLGVAASFEAQGQLAEALTRYQELTTRFPQSSLVDRARLGQARIFEQQGDQAQAFRIYQDLTARNTNPMSQFGQGSPLFIEANLALRRLLKENPALLQVESPAPTPLIAPTELPLTTPAPTDP